MLKKKRRVNPLRWLEMITELRPLTLINLVFALLCALLLFQSAIDFHGHEEALARTKMDASENILSIIESATNDILAIMEKPEEIYTVDPLLKILLDDLRKKDNILGEIIHPPSTLLPEGLNNTPAKVQYWLEKHNGDESIDIDTFSVIRIFLDLLIKRELENPESGALLEKSLPMEEYEKRYLEIKTAFDLIESNDHADIFYREKEGVIDVYSTIKRNHLDCATCHGYDGDRPIFFHFTKDINPEIAEAKTVIGKRLWHRAQNLATVVLLYLVSFVLLRKSISKVQHESVKMAQALEASSDVLKALCTPARLTPLFVTSSVFHYSPTSGGGDSAQWINFRFNYAGFCLHDVSGHGIQETLLNLYATAITDSCKINRINKSVNTPSQFFKALNNKIYRFCQSTPIYANHYLTSAFALMDFTENEITISLAGHPPLLLIRPDKSVEQVGKPGLILGQFESDFDNNLEFIDVKLKLKDDELLLLYTDGLMEQENKEGVSFQKIFYDLVLPVLSGKNHNDAFDILEKQFSSHIEQVACEDDVSFAFIGTRPKALYESSEVVLYKGAVSSDSVTSYLPIIEKLIDIGWSPTRVDHIKSSIDELLLSSPIIIDECALNLSHIVHDDVLELKLSCACSNLAVMLSEYKDKIHTIKFQADEIYFDETGHSCWLLFTREG